MLIIILFFIICILCPLSYIINSRKELKYKWHNGDKIDVAIHIVLLTVITLVSISGIIECYNLI